MKIGNDRNKRTKPKIERVRLRPAPREPTREEIEAAQLFDCIAKHREQMEGALSDFLKYISDHPCVRPAWERFVINGGVTGADLLKHATNTAIDQQRPVTRRGLLRVVASSVPQSG